MCEELESCRVGFISPSHFADKEKGSHRLRVHHRKGEHERLRIWIQVCLVPGDPETSGSWGQPAVSILWRTSSPECPGTPHSSQSRQDYLKISWVIALLYITWYSTTEKQKQVQISDCMWGLQGDMRPHSFLLNNAFPSTWEVVPAQPFCLIPNHASRITTLSLQVSPDPPTSPTMKRVFFFFPLPSVTIELLITRIWHWSPHLFT